MLEFKIIQDLKPNDEILEIIKIYEYTMKILIPWNHTELKLMKSDIIVLQ